MITQGFTEVMADLDGQNTLNLLAAIVFFDIDTMSHNPQQRSRCKHGMVCEHDFTSSQGSDIDINAIVGDEAMNNQTSLIAFLIFCHYLLLGSSEYGQLFSF